MNTEELRAKIWDYLYQSHATRSIDDLATRTGHGPAAIREAVNHNWFHVADDRVSIAMAASERRYGR